MRSSFEKQGEIQKAVEKTEKIHQERMENKKYRHSA